MATVAPHTEEAESAIVFDEEPRSPWWSLPATTTAAVGAVLAWFAVQLGRFVGEAPDMDAIISLARVDRLPSATGLKGLIADRVGTRRAPAADGHVDLRCPSRVLRGRTPRSQQLLGVALFIAPRWRRRPSQAARAVAELPGYRVLGALAVAMTPSLAVVLFHGLA